MKMAIARNAQRAMNTAASQGILERDRFSSLVVHSWQSPFSLVVAYW
jgi:hypothetical protein